MTVGSMLSVQLGLSLSITVAHTIGPGGAAWLRLCTAGLLLLAVGRPWTVRWTPAAFGVCVLLGVATAAMSSLFMLAATRISLGTASALEFAGPLAIALWRAPRAGRAVALCAGAGIVLLTRPWEGGVDGLGVLFALAAGVCWAAYILLTDRAGGLATGLRPLGISIPVAAVLASLVWSWGAAPHLTAGSVVPGVVAGLLNPGLAFALELLALRRLPTATFSTLMSVEPAIAAAIGLLVLAQPISAAEGVGIGLVVVSSIAAERMNRPRSARSAAAATGPSLAG